MTYGFRSTGPYGTFCFANKIKEENEHQLCISPEVPDSYARQCAGEFMDFKQIDHTHRFKLNTARKDGTSECSIENERRWKTHH
jgi:hypothetical protein